MNAETAPSDSHSPLAAAWRWSVKRSPLARTYRAIHHKLRPQQRAHERLAAASLPEPVRARIAEIVRRTRLRSIERDQVGHELIDHAEDALAHTPDPQRVAQALGAPRAAAPLIRRAMKRKRSAFYQARLWLTRATLVGFAALVLLYAGLFIRFQSGSPTISTDYLALMNQGAESVPESDRLYPVLQEVRSEWRTIERRIDGLNSDLIHAAQAADEPIPDNPWSVFPGLDSQHPLHSQMLEAIIAFRPQIDRLNEASRRPVMGFEYANKYQAADGTQLSEPDSGLVSDGALVGVLLPFLGEARQAAKLLAADARLAAIDSDADRVTQDLAAITNIARLLAPDPFLISDLVALAVHNTASAEIRRHLSQTPELFSADQLLTLSHSLAASAELAETTDLKGETYLMEDLLQRAFTDNGHGDGRLTPAGLEGLMALNVMSSWQTPGSPDPEPSTLTRLAGPVSMEVIASRGKLSALHRQHMDAARATLLEGPEALPDLFRLAYELEHLGPIEEGRVLPVTLVLPAITKAIENFLSSRIRTDATLVALAAEHHRREHGEYPATIEDLVPSNLPDVPQDPFDPGQPMKYRLTDTGPMIYVAGADGDDDGGTRFLGDGPRKARRGPEWVELLRMRYPRPDRVYDNIPDGDWILFPPQP
ncbi:MAG: hypothetical protein ACI89L_000287 [Phycisphaerales bacterium]|jgi:hypothetical protein